MSTFIELCSNQDLVDLGNIAHYEDLLDYDVMVVVYVWGEQTSRICNIIYLSATSCCYR